MHLNMFLYAFSRDYKENYKVLFMRKKGKYAEHRIKCRKIDLNVKKMSLIFKEKKDIITKLTIC